MLELKKNPLVLIKQLKGGNWLTAHLERPIIKIQQLAIGETRCFYPPQKFNHVINLI